MSNHVIVTYLHRLIERLNAYYHDAVLSEQYAWWILETITQKNRLQLLGSTVKLTAEQETEIERWVDALINQHMPIQYLIGNVPFCDLTITIKQPTLIPRPETEQWCSDLIARCLAYNAEEPLRILDLCSGSGCIGLAWAHAFPNAQVVCADIEPQTIALGRYNAQLNGIQNVTFIESDLFTSLTGMQFDLILTNPPYISEDEYTTLDASVTAWEDKKALVADDAGLALIDKIITQAPIYLRFNEQLERLIIPQLVIEHGSTQATQIVDLMRNAGYIHVQAHKDLSDKDRVVSGRLPYVVPTKKRV